MAPSSDRMTTYSNGPALPRARTSTAGQYRRRRTCRSPRRFPAPPARAATPGADAREAATVSVHLIGDVERRAGGRLEALEQDVGAHADHRYGGHRHDPRELAGGPRVQDLDVGLDARGAGAGIAVEHEQHVFGRLRDRQLAARGRLVAEEAAARPRRPGVDHASTAAPRDTSNALFTPGCGANGWPAPCPPWMSVG